MTLDDWRIYIYARVMYTYMQSIDTQCDAWSYVCPGAISAAAINRLQTTYCEHAARLHTLV